MAGILSRVSDAAIEFSSSAILPTLREAAAQAGFTSDGADLLRIGENAIYQPEAAPVVVRIARSADRLRRVERELRGARRLATAGVPRSACTRRLISHYWQMIARSRSGTR